ncbi:PREDICTED: protein disulfide-isomerase A2 [Nanorana parkeri]|uniref:protein disulfide-isomerase A2 n=1 Tax=Nanorana parkeri TaxID=125878 RepID=UPI0008546BD5|nr:PREDICTED: protein disulfide-isomerase A2 [Nanorana parkeri]
MRWIHLLLLGLLSFCHVRADGSQNASSAESSETSSEEKSDDVLEEDNVLVLNTKNFDNALQTYKYLLVEFYAPWCGHCQELAPKYSKAAETLKDQTSEARLAKVDATVESALGEEFGVKGYPTLLFFKGGNRTSRIDFGGRRDADGIVNWMLRRMEPSTTVIETAAKADEFIKSHEYSVIAFFQDPQDSDLKTYGEVADTSEDFTFAIVHKKEIFQKFGVTADAVLFFTQSGEKYEHKLDEEVGLDKDELSRFLSANSMDLVTEYNEKTSERIFAAKIPNHLLLFVNKTEESQLQLVENFRGAAAEFKGQVLFVSIDAAGPHAGILEYFGLQNSDIPTIRFINIDLVKKYAFRAEKITTEAVREFCQGVLDGKIKQNLLTEELPEDWDKKPVKVLVGTNFDEVAYDETKNVFVEFYAPWCTHCKELEPIWEELGEKYKDHPNVIIAKMDATANEIDGMRVRGFPNLRFFPAGPGRKMIEYTKNRTVELFTKFIDSGGVLPVDEEEQLLENLKDDQRGDIKVEDVVDDTRGDIKVEDVVDDTRGDIKVEDVVPEKPKEEL